MIQHQLKAYQPRNWLDLGPESEHSQQDALFSILWPDCHHAWLQADGSQGQGQAAFNRPYFV
jgi:hypothetical protein